MERTIINPPELYKHPAYSRINIVEGPCKLIFIAGQTPSDENYRAVFPEYPKAQYLHVIAALTLQLEAAGATWDDVVYRRMYVTDMDAFQKVMRDPSITVPGHRVPTTGSVLIGVTRLSSPDFLIEMDLTAAVDA